MTTRGYSMWAEPLVQFFALLAVVTPAVGYLGRAITFAWAEPALPVPELLPAYSFVAATIAGAAVLVSVITLSGAPVAWWTLMASPERDLADVERRMQGLRRSIDDLREGPSDDVRRLAVERGVSNLEDRIEGMRQHVSSSPTRRVWVYGSLLAGHLIVAWAIPWTMSVTTLGVAFLGYEYLVWLRRRLAVRRAGLWPVAVFAVIGSLMISATMSPVGQPVAVEMSDAQLGTDRHILLARDDQFTYLWPCEDSLSESRVVAVPNSRIEEIRFEGSELRQRSLFEVLRQRSFGPVRPYVACG